MERRASLCYDGVVVPSEQAYRRVQRRADHLCFLILAGDLSEREFKIERLYLRTEFARIFPEKLSWYDMIYESRFRRIWEQFRQPIKPRDEGQS